MKHAADIAAMFSMVMILAVSGCATAINGRTQEVPISSEPPGATVLVDGVNVGTTPTTVMLTRHDSHSVRIEKPGYVIYEMTTVTITSKWIYADLAPGLIVPPLILIRDTDQDMGGAYEVRPTEVYAHLIAVADDATTTNAPAPSSPGNGTSTSDANQSSSPKNDRGAPTAKSP
jgi:hypothetical protein